MSLHCSVTYSMSYFIRKQAGRCHITSERFPMSYYIRCHITSERVPMGRPHERPAASPRKGCASASAAAMTTTTTTTTTNIYIYIYILIYTYIYIYYYYY